MNQRAMRALARASKLRAHFWASIIAIFSRGLTSFTGTDAYATPTPLARPVPLPDGPLIVVANHSSHADSVALLATLGRTRPVLVVSASDYWEQDSTADWVSSGLVGTFAISRSGDGMEQLRGAADLVMPSKLVGMLASGRPVIAAGLPGSEMAHVVTGCGLVIEPENAEVLSQAIVNMANDPQWRERLGAAGRLYAERTLDSKAIFDRLDDTLVLLVDPHHAQSGVLAAARAASEVVISAAADAVGVTASGADPAQ